MASNSKAPTVALVTGRSLKPFVDFLDRQGAPTSQWMAEARVVADAVCRRDALVPMNCGYRFLHRASQTCSLRRLPVLVAKQTSPFDLGSLGQGLRRARTVDDYLRIGSRFMSPCSNSGAEVRLSREGDELRVNLRFARARGPLQRCDRFLPPAPCEGMASHDGHA